MAHFPYAREGDSANLAALWLLARRSTMRSCVEHTDEMHPQSATLA